MFKLEYNVPEVTGFWDIDEGGVTLTLFTMVQREVASAMQGLNDVRRTSHVGTYKQTPFHLESSGFLVYEPRCCSDKRKTCPFFI